MTSIYVTEHDQYRLKEWLVHLGAEPLPGPTLFYCQFDPYETWVEFESNCETISMNVVCKMAAILFRPRRIKTQLCGHLTAIHGGKGPPSSVSSSTARTPTTDLIRDLRYGEQAKSLWSTWCHSSTWIKGHYSGISEVSTVYPKKYAHGFVVLCFVVVMQSFIMNSHEVFIHIHQGCFAGTGAIVRLPQCQWSKPDGYGKISQCITTTKHSKAKTVCIFLGIYCKYGYNMSNRLRSLRCTKLNNT